MMQYVSFLAEVIFWSFLYITFLRWACVIPVILFSLINQRLTVIVTAVQTYMISLYYAIWVKIGVNEFGLNPVVLCIIFALMIFQIFVSGFPKRGSEIDKYHLNALMIFGLIPIPLFVVMFVFNLFYFGEVIVAYFKLSEWILSVPIIGVIIKFILGSMSGIIVFVWALLAILLSIAPIVYLFGIIKDLVKPSAKEDPEKPTISAEYDAEVWRLLREENAKAASGETDYNVFQVRAYNICKKPLDEGRISWETYCQCMDFIHSVVPGYGEEQSKEADE